MKKLIFIVTAFLTFQLNAQNPPDVFPSGLVIGDNTIGYKAGQLRYNSGILQFWNGTQWHSLDFDSVEPDLSIYQLSRTDINTATFTALESDISTWSQFIIKDTQTDVTFTIPETTLTGDINYINIYHEGTGDVTIAAGTGVTFTTRVFEDVKRITLYSTTDDVWLVKEDNTVQGSGNEYTNPTDTINGRLRKYILPSSFDFSNIPTDYDNAIWEIRYIFDLANADVTLPENVVLQFNGGRIINGKIIASTVTVSADLVQIFDSTTEFEADFTNSHIFPQWFGAVADGTTDSSEAFQSAFNFITQTNVNTDFHIPAGDYYISKTLILPSITENTFLNINGYGATLETDKPSVSIFKRMPEDQDEAMSMISDGKFVIKGISFRGSSEPLQKGIEIGATYGFRVEDCTFNNLDFGLEATFALQSTFDNLRFGGITSQPLTLQSAFRNYEGVPLWDGAKPSNSASNVSTVKSCRVFGSSTQDASYFILGSDAIRIIDCVSEGGGTLYDLFFDYNGSTTVKNFYIENFHAESPSVKVNFKVRGINTFRIKGLRRSNDAAIWDLSGSAAMDVELDNCVYWGNMPDVWFYHTNGGGYGGTASGDSGASTYSFINNNSRLLLEDEVWENDLRPRIGSLIDMSTTDGYLQKVNGTGVTIRDDDFNRNFSLDGFNLMFETDNVRYIGKKNNVVTGRPKGIAVGTDGIEFDTSTVQDVINGTFDVDFNDIGTISSNSTKSIILEKTDYLKLTGLNSEFVTDLNIKDDILPSGILISNIETKEDTLVVRLANITSNDVIFNTDLPINFNSIRRYVPFDFTAPTITLLGDNPQTTGYGVNFVDQGATATDDHDDYVNDKILVTGTVDVNSLGANYIYYNVTDESGNEATEVVRTVNVVDLGKPEISLIGNSALVVNTGDTYVDDGATATDNYDGDITSSIVTVNNVDTSTQGTYYVTYDVTDAAGNIADTVTRTVVVEDTVSYLLDSQTGSKGAYSLRQLKTGITYVAKIIRSGDNASMDVTPIDITGGALASWVTSGGGSMQGKVSILYDQSGYGNDLVQADLSRQPLLVDNGVLNLENGLPTIKFNGVDEYLQMTDLTIGNLTDKYMHMVLSIDSSETKFCIISDKDGAGAPFADSTSTASPSFNYTIEDYYINGTAFNGTTREDYYLGYTSLGQNITTIHLSEDSPVNRIFGRTSFFTAGSLQEAIFYDLDNSANRLSIESNLNSYYSAY